jgi:hypothetical protein
MARRPSNAQASAAIARREESEYRFESLWANEERQAHLTRSREICDFILPHASSLLCTSAAHADERFRHIFDTTATEALTISVAGHMTYATPMGVGWLSLTLRNEPDLAENGEVKAFLKDLGRSQMAIGQQSNTEADFKILTRDSLAFGGGASIVDEDDKYTIWHHNVPVGTFALDTNFRGQVDTLYREFRLTLRETARQFGPERLPQELRTRFGQGAKNWNEPVHIIHGIEPREGGKSRSEDGTPVPSNRMAWRSVYWVRDSKKDDGILRESGYRVFPVLAPRYDIQGNGIYGYGPGPMALAHVRSLQHLEHRRAEVIDWQTKGMFSAPTQALGSNQWRPGGHVVSDNPAAIKNVVDNQARLDHLLALKHDFREQIRRVLHADTFTLLSSIDAKDVTAEAIREKRQEKMDILGPQTARLISELPRPWVDIVFDVQEAKGLLPPIPQVLQERRVVIDPEFESVLAKAAKSQRMSSLTGFMSVVGATAQTIDKRALHKVKSFGIVNEAAKTFDVAPEIVRSDEEAQGIADAEAQAQAQADAVQMGNMRAQSIRDVGSVSTSDPNIATEALGVGGA